jgi:EF hand
MQRYLTALMFSALLLVCTGARATDQQFPEAAVTPESSQQRFAQAGRFGRYDTDDEDEDRWDRRRRSYPRQDPRDWDRDRGGQAMPDRYGRDEPRRGDRNEQRRGFPVGALGALPMGRSIMMQFMMILMDTDGDGAISLQEFQAGQERIFKAMDADKDGRLTLDEIRNFHLGQASNKGPQ